MYLWGEEMKTIKLSKQAEKFLDKQTSKMRDNIIKIIKKIPTNTEFLDIKPYQGGAADFRLKIGRIRILYDENGNIIDIIRVGYRGDVYKKR